MSDYNILIARCTFLSGENGASPMKIIGFSVQSPDGVKQIYHETILGIDQFAGKTDEQCADLAFSILSGSIAASVSNIINTPSILGNYYIPN